MINITKHILLMTLISLLLVPTAFAASPYGLDADTLHLYHLDLGGQDQAGGMDLTFANGATLETSLDGFSNAASTYDGTADTGRYVGDSVNKIQVSDLVASNGAFTFEAIVKPLVSDNSIPHHMEIICLEDSSSAGERGFQFRINNTGQLRFQTLAGIVTAYDAPISFTSGKWYHAAVTYNGEDATADNLKFYWTDIEADADVKLVGSFQLAEDLKASVDGYFSIGNELRPTAYSENFEGYIDEVRISRIARDPMDMLYLSDEPRPEIIQSPIDTSVKSNERATFNGVFTTESLGQVIWYKVALPFDVQVSPSDNRVSITQNYDPDTLQYTSTLSINNCSVADEGDYYVSVQNESGRKVISDKASLTVQGLLAHWTLDKADFTDLHYIESIAGKNAYVQSLPAFVLGANAAIDGAVMFTSQAGWAITSENAPIILPQQFTLSYWVKQQSQQDLLLEGSDNPDIIVTGSLLADDQWLHIVIVFDGTMCRLYLDGKLSVENEWNLPEAMAATLSIGADELGNERYHGQLDDIRIYNYAMDNTEIALLRYTFSGLSSCLGPYSQYADWSGPSGLPDCKVDMYDFEAFASAYSGSNSLYDISGPLNLADGEVNLYDFIALASVWLDCGLFPECL